eukprot:m.228279 g.228279  ORF g.228279 m.228279 type:complete len:53 (+) comp18827_c0_seq8:3162-3320(+)
MKLLPTTWQQCRNEEREKGKGVQEKQASQTWGLSLLVEKHAQSLRVWEVGLR